MTQKSKISELNNKLNNLHSVIEVLTTENKELKTKLSNLEKRMTDLESIKPELHLESAIVQQIQEKVQANVEKKVEKEQSTWSQVVSNNIIKANKKNAKAEVKQINEEIKREKNIIMKGVKYCENNDTNEVEEILRIIMPNENVKFEGLERIGKKAEGKIQPIVITVTNKKKVYEILKNKNKLRNEEKVKHVFLEKDLTVMEQKEQYDLRCELKERRKNGFKCKISKNKIVDISEEEQLERDDTAED